MSKKIILSVISLICALTLALSSCGASMGETLMSLGGEKISVNMYRLWLSRIKGAYGGADETVWQRTEGGKTYDEIFTGYVTENAKTFLSALYEFGKLGLKLPDEKVNEIDTSMQKMLDERAGGSKTELNSVLSEYGVNYDILREIYMIEAKSAYLEEYLYGKGGIEEITDETRNEFYEKEYVRIKQIFFYTANKPVTDEDGNYTYDDDGHVITRDYTEEEISAQREKASLVTASLTSGQDFELLMASQNEDKAASEYPSGYYFTKTSQYASGVVDAAFALAEGEFTTVESEYGIHIIKRLPLEEKGYASNANADFFSDFEDNLRTGLFTARLLAYVGKIKVNEDLLAKYTVGSSPANLYY